MESLTCEEDAGFHELLVVLSHLGEELRVWHDARLRLLGCFDHYHEPHVPLLVSGLDVTSASHRPS